MLIYFFLSVLLLISTNIIPMKIMFFDNDYRFLAVLKTMKSQSDVATFQSSHLHKSSKLVCLYKVCK